MHAAFHFSISIIVTTDVQSARVVVTCDSVLMQCTFLSGGQNKGCSLNLTINESMITHNIERSNSTSVQEEIVVSSNQVVIGESFAFDWESDGSIGSVSVPVVIGSRNCSDVTPTSVPG